MAWIILPQPGTEFGPCEGTCRHVDCAETRAMAALVCPLCRHPAGYNAQLTQDDTGRQCHTACLWDQEAERQARMRGGR